jgi:hypothetical protein
MKKIMMIILILASTTMLYAQGSLGVQIGYAQPTTQLNTPDLGKTLTPTIYNGLKLGLVYETTIIKGFGVNMGLNYTFGANATDWMKKVTNQPVDYPKVRSKRQYHQLEIPIDWQYKFEIAKGTWLIVYTGPTLQCGLYMDEKWYINTGKVNGITLTQTENLYSAEDMNDYALKRINVTWGVGAGFQYERYFLRGGYDFGLINPYKAQSFEGQDINTRGRFDQWQIKIGMYLWESK